MNDKIIGIIGGMGPEATADFYSKIIKATKVTKDQDHFRVIIDSNPKIPDRTKAIIGEGESPLPEMIKTAKNLELAKVEVACIPCITAHYFIDEIRSEVNYEILNALEVLNEYIKSNYKNARKIGVLSTTGTMRAGMFHKYLPDYEIVYPNDKDQEEEVMKAIYGENGIKCGNYGMEPISLLVAAANSMISQGADLIVSGCTEISIVLTPDHIIKPLIDTMEVLANKVVNGD